MKYLLYGDDSLTLRSRKTELINSFLEKNPDGKVETFTFPEALTTGAFIETLYPGLFETPKLLVFENVSSIFDTAPEQVQEVLNATTPSTCIFLEYEKAAKIKPLLKEAKKVVDKEEEYNAKQRNVQKLIDSLQEELGVGSIDTKTLLLVQERSGKNDELLLQNIRKILTYTNGKALSKAEFDALLPVTLETKVFTALDALIFGRKEEALVLFEKLLKQDDVFRILPLCAWQIRQMLLVMEAQAKFGNQKEKIAKETEIHPFVVQKILGVLPHFSRARLAKGLKLLASLDTALKQGKKTGPGAVHEFIFQW